MIENEIKTQDQVVVEKQGVTTSPISKDDKKTEATKSNGFVDWLNGNYQGESYGNGASMRISPVGYLFDSLENKRRNLKKFLRFS